MSRKKKRSIIDELFGGSILHNTELLGKSSGSGYSISVVQTSEGTKVKAKVGKNADAGALRRQLQQQYPNAQIEIEGGRPLIREISTKTFKQEGQSEENSETKS